MCAIYSKYVPLALCAATARGETVSSSGSIRFPIRYGAKISRWRIHIRNYNYASGRSFASGGLITGIWFGDGANGEFSAPPQQVSTQLTIAQNGADRVSPWINVPIAPCVDYLLSVGWTSDPGAKVETAGGAWVSTSADVAGAIRHSSYRPEVFVPFDWWIEAETPSTTQTVAGYGDSITVGTGTESIVHTSWLSQYARLVGALPIHRAFPGSGMILWTDPRNHKWDRWRRFQAADYVIHAMGQNDLGSAETDTVMRARFETTLPMLRSLISPNVIVSTITPHANKSSHQNSVRRSHAEYLRSLPLGVLGLIDFASAVSDDDTGLRPEYRGGSNGVDELHPGTEGAARMASIAAQAIKGVRLSA